MSLRKTLFLFCLVASTACLAVAYALVGSWQGACAVVLPGLFPLFHRKIPGRWLPPAFLSCMLCAAAVGLFAGASPHLMLPGAALALAAWDLMNLDRVMAGSGSAHSAGRFEMRHARVLALTLGLGLLLAEGGIVLSVPLPFPVMLLLVILVVFSLSRVFRVLVRESGRSPGPRR
jgi:hypothetical protein